MTVRSRGGERRRRLRICTQGGDEVGQEPRLGEWTPMEGQLACCMLADAESASRREEMPRERGAEKERNSSVRRGYSGSPGAGWGNGCGGQKGRERPEGRKANRELGELKNRGLETLKN
jgi:hypothetical protein